MSTPAPSSSKQRALLDVRELSVSFHTEEGDVTAVDRVSFEVPRGSTVAIVGESGCGKSVTAHSIMRLLPEPPARVDHGQVLFEGQDLLSLSERRMRRVRGSAVSLIFQDPVAALNPVYTVGQQVREAIHLNTKLRRGAARARALELLERVGFPEPRVRFGDYPHELSGGMCQRVMIAIALAGEPALVIADEPTTALDMLAASQIITLLGQLKREEGLSLLLISHDIGIVGELADHIVVLYAGQVVERGTAEQVLGNPGHPYTRGLLGSVPPARPRGRRRRPTPTRLPSILGSVPDLRELPRGCRFSSRCPDVFSRCQQAAPELSELSSAAHAVRCFLYDEDGAPSQPVRLAKAEAAHD